MFSLSLILLTSRPRVCLVQEFTDTEAYGGMPVNVSSPGLYNKANVFLGLSRSASHLVDFIPVHFRFSLERYLLNIRKIRAKF